MLVLLRGYGFGIGALSSFYVFVSSYTSLFLFSHQPFFQLGSVFDRIMPGWYYFFCFGFGINASFSLDFIS
jgi:hypothetical protein